jgi:UDP-N-acetyl-D-mannosaminuronate dehydrogenase
MKTCKDIVVAGLGEVGRPLFELIATRRRVVGVDIAPVVEEIGQVEVLHVCYPFQIDDFIGHTVRYIEKFEPELTIVNSTVDVGTTRLIAERSGTSVVNSPIRGKHVKMFEDLCKYSKFVGAIDEKSRRHAIEHFESVGLKTVALSSPEATELAKLTETTYFGLMIAWAQEVERYCDQAKVSYDEVASFYDEIRFFPPVKYFPGIIGGHCVMPNIAILRRQHDSLLLEAVQESNKMKIERDAQSQLTDVSVEKLAVLD